MGREVRGSVKEKGKKEKGKLMLIVKESKR
jgi:hypothetical protein